MIIQFQMVEPETIHMSKITQTGRVVVILLEIYLTMTNDEKSHEFEREQGDVYGVV